MPADLLKLKFFDVPEDKYIYKTVIGDVESIVRLYGILEQRQIKMIVTDVGSGNRINIDWGIPEIISHCESLSKKY